MKNADQIDHIFIVGAGFSHNAGLPLASEFTDALLDVEQFRPNAQSKVIVEFLRKFVEETFDHKATVGAKFWPELEDIFTCLDLSANTGHHLGPNHSPAQLRSVRRGFIVRIHRMLHQRYSEGLKKKTLERRNLDNFFKRVKTGESAFLSLNWDTVIEHGLIENQNIQKFDYGCNAVCAEFSTDEIRLRKIRSAYETAILKPHGSINWLYCDSCRQVLWFPPDSGEKIAARTFRESDWEAVKKQIPVLSDNVDQVRKPLLGRCPLCKASSLGTRLATFSYRKAIDFPALDSTWMRAEALLRNAVNWVFIGYSLPAADYEFKHLLKHVQLSRSTSPNIILITAGSAASVTRENYQKFFGPNCIQGIFTDGLDGEAATALAKFGILNRRVRLANK